MEEVISSGGFFFVKQKTAYEMSVSDWSSDVCSSDLRLRGADVVGAAHALAYLARRPRDLLDLVRSRGAAPGRVAREVDDGVGGGEREERRHDGTAVDHGIRLLDLVAQLRAQLRRLGQRTQTLGLDLGAVGRHARERDP